MAKILDIEKIGELGKLNINNLKLLLKEILGEILEEQKQTEEFKIDISVILKLLYEKGLISKEEYENLKDKLNSLINSDKVDDAYNDNISQDVIEEIIKRSKFKGFFKSYEDLIIKIPINKATHGDYAYIKDFDADTYNVNNIEEYIFDITYKKWMSATDTTHLRNVYIREDEDDTGRIIGQPLDNDLLQYNEALKRWICKTYEEADVARKSVLDFHTSNKIELVKDEIGGEDGSIKDNGRLIPKLRTDIPKKEPMHIDTETFSKLLQEIDNDYYSAVSVTTEIDELGVEKIVVSGEDDDKYGNAVRRNITNQVLRKILDNLYSKLFDMFDIKKDPTSGRILELNEEEPRKYAPRSINTFNVDKIIQAIDNDYNNSFTLEDKEEGMYIDILKRVLTGYNELDITDENSGPIIERLTTLYSNKKVWDRYTKILSYKKNKNMTPEVFNELIDIIHYLYISKDLVRDEIKERDITINGNRTYTNNVKYTGNDKTFTGEFSSFKLTNKLSEFLISSNVIKFDNPDSNLTVSSTNITFDNPNGNFSVSKDTTLEKNLDIKGKIVVGKDATFENDVLIKGNLTVKGKTTNVESEDLNVKDNIITLNKDEQGNGVSRRTSGLKIERGQADDFYFLFDEVGKKLVCGELPNEDTHNFDKLDLVAIITNDGLDPTKPIIYNPETNRLENSEYIRTDINGATTFLLNINNHNFKKLDPVYFDRDELKLCSLKSLETAEIIGVIGDIINNNFVKVVVNGFIPAQEFSDIPNGQVLFLDEGKLSTKKHPLIQRKVAIKIPNGIIIDIQKNSSLESNEVIGEQVVHKRLDPYVTEYICGYDLILDWDIKVFVDGSLLVQNVHYKIDKNQNKLILLHGYSYDIDLVIIKNYKFGNFEFDFISNEEIDNMFGGSVPLPPFIDAEYMQDYEVDRIFGIMTEPTPGEPVVPIESEWMSKEEVDDIFGIRKEFKAINFKQYNQCKKIFTKDNYIHYFANSKKFELCDFISLNQKGELSILNFNSQSLIGIVEDIIELDNGIIEYVINTSKVISYNSIPIVKFNNRYNVSINFGDKLYINSKVNKFSGNPICTFSNVGLFIDYKVLPKEITKQEKDDLTTLVQDEYYAIITDKMSISTIDLFEVDSYNYCKLNLINNTLVSEKNMYYDIQLGNKIFSLYRRGEEFIIKPHRNLKCNTKLKIYKTTNENLIEI